MHFKKGSGIPELENLVEKTELHIMTSQNRVKSNCDVIANFSLLGIFNENQISELRNSEILSLFINTNIPENLSFIKKASLKESFQPLR